MAKREFKQRSLAYWKKRGELIAHKQFQITEQYAKEVVKDLSNLQEEVSKELASLYAKYGTDGKLTTTDLNKLLSKAETERFVNKMMKYKGVIKNQSFNSALERLNDINRITRLRSHDMQLQAQILEFFEKYELDTKDFLGVRYTESYYQTIHMMQSGLGVGTSFNKINPTMIEVIINKPWEYGTLSESIWSNQRETYYNLRQCLLRQAELGKPLDETARMFAKLMGTTSFRARNVIYTEHALIAGEATAQGYIETGLERYQYTATLDHKTSFWCRQLDGKDFKVSARQVGVNYPPMHNFCRSTTVPYYEDVNNMLTRIARDASGRTYTVPENMSYYDWYKKYVDPKGHPDTL